jgi:hypothetical protein
MSQPQTVEGLFDNLRLLSKYAPLLAELRKLPEFWGFIKSGQLDKAGDLIEAVLTKLGYGAIGDVIDEILGAVESKSLPNILRRVGEAFVLVADLLEGKTQEEAIRFPTVGSGSEGGVVAIIDKFGLDQPPTVASGPEPVGMDPMTIIAIISAGIQALRLIREWRKK